MNTNKRQCVRGRDTLPFWYHGLLIGALESIALDVPIVMIASQ